MDVVGHDWSDGDICSGICSKLRAAGIVFLRVSADFLLDLYD